MTTTEETDEGVGPEANERLYARVANLARVELRFEDASIPPQYHRSYTINVEPRKVTTLIDVYGEVIARDEAPVAKEAWSEIEARVPTRPIAGNEDDGATGTSLHAVRIWRNLGPVRELSWTSLTPPSPELRAAQEFAQRLEALVPKLQALRETEYLP